MNLPNYLVFNKVYDAATRSFEQKLGKFLEADYVLTVCNATTGIMGVLYALGITDAEIVTTPLSWSGTLSGPLMLNNRVVFAELEEPTLNIDPCSLEKYITKKTKCVLTSDFLGMPAKLDVIHQICSEHGVWLIHDAATSFGSTYQGHSSGYFADVCIHSFGRNKAFTTGEGGCVSSHNETLFDAIVGTMAHPDRQRFQRDEINPLAMNTTMHPLAIDYGLSTFEAQISKLNKHRDDVIQRLHAIGAEELLTEGIPNFYKPFLDMRRYGNLPFDWKPLPYQSLSYDIRCHEQYKVAENLCING